MQGTRRNSRRCSHCRTRGWRGGNAWRLHRESARHAGGAKRRPQTEFDALRIGGVATRICDEPSTIDEEDDVHIIASSEASLLAR